MASVEARIKNVNSVASSRMEETRIDNEKFKKDLDKLKKQEAKIMGDARARFDAM